MQLLHLGLEFQFEKLVGRSLRSDLQASMFVFANTVYTKSSVHAAEYIVLRSTCKIGA